ncbi:MAG: YMGG-like glycine zipper-containing protein [Flavisolibacter sp.]
MKRLIPFFSAALILAACNTTPRVMDNPAAGTVQPAPVSTPDTTGLASYQAWKSQNELADAKSYQRSGSLTQAGPSHDRTAPPPVQRVKKTAQRTVALPPLSSGTPSGSAGNGQDSTNSGGQISSESSQTAKAQQKKGWSNTTKGAVIGGVVGAGAGAVINKKNPVVGAVIGAVLGAGGGYVIGRKMDHKTGF